VRDAGAERNEVRERREAVELAEGLLQLRIIFHVPEGFRVGILDTVTLKHIRRRHRFENELVDQRQDQRDEQRPLRLHRRLRGQPRKLLRVTSYRITDVVVVLLARRSVRKKKHASYENGITGETRGRWDD